LELWHNDLDMPDAGRAIDFLVFSHSPVVFSMEPPLITLHQSMRLSKCTRRLVEGSKIGVISLSFLLLASFSLPGMTLLEVKPQQRERTLSVCCRRGSSKSLEV
jgi:hypothetical protein